MQQYIYQSACKLAKLIREGQATSVDIVQEHLTRIKERDGQLNAFVELFGTEALAVAAERDQQAKEGRFLGPLHGVPVSNQRAVLDPRQEQHDQREDAQGFRRARGCGCRGPHSEERGRDPGPHE